MVLVQQARCHQDEDRDDLVIATLLVQQSAPVIGDFQQSSLVHDALGHCEDKLLQLQREPYNQPWQGDKEHFYNDQIVHYLQVLRPVTIAFEYHMFRKSQRRIELPRDTLADFVEHMAA